MPFSHFTPEQLLPLLIGAPLILLSIGLFKGKPRLALGSLFAGVLCFGLFMAGLDPFLNLWDEQFHALVAKHLSVDPLFPKLYPEPVLEHDHRNWTSSYIWLHKEPLFLWQMALSIGFFGTNELAVRLPTVLMHAITVLFIYRIGRIMVNRMTGFYGALLYGVAYFPLILIVGQVPTDHNDIAFVFYVTCSFWGCFEYQRSKKSGWLIVIGVASAGAVLVKWLMGFLVFVTWALSVLIVKGRDRFRFSSYYPLFGAALIAVLISLPWQLYIYSAFPELASYEMTQKAMHFSKAVEDHTGGFAFHFTKGLNKI